MSHVAREMQRQGFDDAAADRRRDHVARAHRAEDRSALQVADGLGEGRLARGRRGAVADQQGPARARSSPPTMPTTPRSASATATAATPSGWCRWRRRARRRSTAAGTHYVPPAPTQPGPAPCSTTTRWRSWSTTSTGRRSSTPGSWRAAIRRSSTTTSSARRRASCSRDAQAMLATIVDEKWLTAKAVFGLWPAQQRRRRRRVVDDRRRHATTLHFLRQQVDKPVDRPDFCLADFIAPQGQRQAGLDRRVRRHRRASASSRTWRASRPTTTTTTRSCSRRSPTASPRRWPSACTSACAREFWGYARDEALDNEALIAREVPRHPPGPGLSGLPGPQREGHAVRDCSMRRRNAGMKLTESFAMYPAAAVSGYYFSHPRSQYFVVGRVSQGAGRGLRASARASASQQAERWLASNLDYDPE